MNGRLWSTGALVRVDRVSAEVCGDERLWVEIRFEDQGHAGHPPGVKRGGIIGRIACRYGLGEGQPESVRDGVLALINDARSFGVEFGRQRPAFYAVDTPDTDAASARRQIKPIADELGWEVL